MMARQLLLSSSAERSESKLAKSTMQICAGNMLHPFQWIHRFFFAVVVAAHARHAKGTVELYGLDGAGGQGNLVFSPWKKPRIDGF